MEKIEQSKSPFKRGDQGLSAQLSGLTRRQTSEFLARKDEELFPGQAVAILDETDIERLLKTIGTLVVSTNNKKNE